MAQQFDLSAFEEDLRKTLESNRIAFKGRYKDQLNDLAGLSREQIRAISPQITLETYEALITVVKEASRVNLAQAQLVAQIEQLGLMAVNIAKSVPSLRAFF